MAKEDEAESTVVAKEEEEAWDVILLKMVDKEGSTDVV